MADTSPVPELYRGYLVLLAKSLWGNKFQSKCDPSDLAQQAILEAHLKRDEFRGGNEAAFEGWLRTILAHKVADAIRAFRRQKRDARLERSIEAALTESATRLASALVADQSSPSARAIRNEQMNQLADALARLPADQQEAVTLHHIQGLPLTETAKQMGRTVPSVAGLLRRGVEALRELMGKWR